LKLLVAFAIEFVSTSRLLFYAAGLAIVALCTLLCYAFIARRLYSECHYCIVRNKSIYRELLSFSGWTMYGAFAAVGMMQGNTILLNMYFGPLANAAFGVFC
jgi:O-antigen/teichoic acid export membrane protein